MNAEKRFKVWQDLFGDECMSFEDFEQVLAIGRKATFEDQGDALTIAYMQGRSDGKIEGRKAGIEEAAEIAVNIDPVEVSGYYAQLGDASATKSNIVAAIRRRIEEGG